jgi:hypothetical protein
MNTFSKSTSLSSSSSPLATDPNTTTFLPPYCSIIRSNSGSFVLITCRNFGFIFHVTRAVAWSLLCLLRGLAGQQLLHRAIQNGPHRRAREALVEFNRLVFG